MREIHFGLGGGYGYGHIDGLGYGPGYGSCYGIGQGYGDSYGAGSVYGSGTSRGSGLGCGNGFCFGRSFDRDGQGDGFYGIDCCEIYGFKVVVNPVWRVVNIGCETHSLEYWKSNGKAKAQKESLDVSFEGFSDMFRYCEESVMKVLEGGCDEG